MKKLPRSVRRKIEGLGKAGNLPSGPLVHVVYRNAIGDGIEHIGSANDVCTGIDATGYFTDELQSDVVDAHVYGNGRRMIPEYDGYTSYLEWDGETYYGYLAVAELCDLRYIDAEYYDCAEDAAIAADSLAQSIGEHEWQRDQCRNTAYRLRGELQEANTMRRNAARLAHCGVPCAQWRDMWNRGCDMRDKVWEAIEDSRPGGYREAERESFRDAWLDGWQCGAA